MELQVKTPSNYKAGAVIFTEQCFRQKVMQPNY